MRPVMLPELSLHKLLKFQEFPQVEMYYRVTIQDDYLGKIILKNCLKTGLSPQIVEADLLVQQLLAGGKPWRNIAKKKVE